jgi:RNA polymerase sigma-70 factor (ECF subfamily)
MDRTEFERLYTTYAPDVYRLALSYLHSAHDAEDICHNVFMKLLGQNVQLLPQKEKAFLLTCTANACKNLLRSFWRTRVQNLDETVSYITDEDKTLWDAIGKLSPKYRAVIHLYYYEGYSQGQIAEILKISRSAVQTRMDRARQQLRKELSEDA